MSHKALPAALAFFLLTYPGLARNNNSFPHDPIIEVVMYFESGHSLSAIAELRHVVENAMKPLGINWKWRMGSSIVVGETFNYPIIVRFRGSCDVINEPGSGVPYGALGEAESQDGELIRFAKVDCSRVREFINAQMRFQTAGQRHLIFGRALGRVLAHELYHILAQTARHGKRGLASPALTVEELTCPELEFESTDWQRFSRGMGPVEPVAAAAGND
jgi:hypothetical protein